ncbi:NAD(P)/FAD-dependent oxidoreductase [Tranquillimonas alkanivorans]|uniref:Glycine/D-amino acid oxidase n=1 Tax=Tranquillimonas alkanivorans TaxID=441119 RepID=A0A1I5TZM2_9RHOB|nr:FAD-binding oxidoreductase [Tranquillimonas alkanivorans]SFP88502.1 Glycine/D-amino acid oxidase [Tranquillimonas alkanivorans]
MTDIVVIGGGIAGVSVAARLAPLGDVLLLEGEDSLGFHASGRSAAMFLSEYGNHVVRALNHASAEHHHHADGGVLSPRGVMLLGRAADAEAFEAERGGMEMERLSPQEAAERFPILNAETVAHAALREDVYDLDTDLCLQNFARAARAAGARFETNAQITQIARSGKRWRVHWRTGEAEADILVNAAGAWADPVARLADVAPFGLQPYRRSMALLPSPGGRDTSRWPFVVAAGERWYGKPESGKWAVSPSEADPVDPHDAWADDMVLAEGLARYEEMVTEPVARVERSWAGLRTFAPDNALVIGEDPAAPGFWWLAGQGGYGFQTAPAASALLADLVAGRQPELETGVVAALSPARFRS